MGTVRCLRLQMMVIMMKELEKVVKVDFEEVIDLLSELVIGISVRS